jgi:hypothetical protein
MPPHRELHRRFDQARRQQLAAELATDPRFKAVCSQCRCPLDCRTPGCQTCTDRVQMRRRRANGSRW